MLLLSLLVLVPAAVFGSLRTASVRYGSPNLDLLAPRQSAYDIIVYGSTPGGIMSAIGAANASSSAAILLLTPSPHVGGMTASGLGQTDIGNPAVVGGAAHLFFENICAKYGKTGACYTYEPHVAQVVFEEMLAAFPRITVVLQQTAVGVTKNGSQITSITTGPTAIVHASDDIPTASLTTYSASIFLDASYEGDLLALANVSWAYGREANTTYNETLAGRLVVPNT
jgi:hypothetical protein